MAIHSAVSLTGDPAVVRDLPAFIHYIGKANEPASVDLLRRSRRERFWRATRGWAVCWAGAGVAVFIPLLHYLLVPALVIAGPLVARARSDEHATLLAARGRCPGCGAALAVELGLPARAETSWRCTACGRPLVLQMDPALFETEPASPSTRETR
jgi:hypothetical protein